MSLQSNLKLAHLIFYSHAAAMVVVAVVGPREWLFPVCMTFAATGAALHGLRKTFRQTTGEEADWLGA